MISEMTEEEMLDLAMKLSAQEASSAAQKRRQLEDNDIQKAIAESLHVSDRVCIYSHFVIFVYHVNQSYLLSVNESVH